MVEESGVVRGPVSYNAILPCADPDGVVEVILSWLLLYRSCRQRRSAIRAVQKLRIVLFLGDASGAAILTGKFRGWVRGRRVTQSLVTGGQEDVFGLVGLEIAQKVTPWFHLAQGFAEIAAALQQQNAVNG